MSQRRKTPSPVGAAHDEFIVVIRGDLTSELIQDRADAVLMAMRKPLMLEGRELTLATSIGVSVSETEGYDADTLIQHADIAMYHAKQQGRDNYQLFHPDMAAKAKRNFDYELEMHKSLREQNHLYALST